MEEEEEQFNLRWNLFPSSLSEGLFDLMQEKAFVDVTLGCENQFVQAHKNILSVCSPYFRSLFDVNPCKHPIVILRDVKLTELKALLQFMYRGEVNISEDDLPSLLRTADALCIKGLTSNKGLNRPEDKTSNESEPSAKKRRHTSDETASLDKIESIEVTEIKIESDNLDIDERSVSAASDHEQDPLSLSQASGHHCWTAKDSPPPTTRAQNYLQPMLMSMQSERPPDSLPGPSQGGHDSMEVLVEPDQGYMQSVLAAKPGLKPGTLLRTMLEKDSSGKILLTKPTLTTDGRNTLGDIIAREMLNLHGYDKMFRDEEYSKWTREIVSIYPLEHEGTFYTKYDKGPPKVGAKGILHNKISKERRRYNLLKSSLKTSSKRSSNVPVASSSSSTSGQSTSTQVVSVSSDMQAKLHFLRTRDEPWDVVVKYWAASNATRRQERETKELSLADLCASYPSLSDDRVAQLFMHDFKLLYPEKINKMTGQWPGIVHPLLKVFEERSRKQLAEIKIAHPNVDDSTLAFLVLPNIFPVTTMKRKNSIGAPRPTGVEMQEGFITIINSLDDFDELIETRMERMQKWRTHLKPFVIIVGSTSQPEGFYVSICSKLLPCGSLVEAVDLCFKSFHSLCLTYPMECAIVWSFIQSYVYGITTEKDVPFIKVMELVSDINKICYTQQ